VPGGAPPAWRTGDAEPWPSQRDVAKARRAAREPAPEPEPELPHGTAPARPHPSSKKRKRKRRS
jgi:hypothetical protein